MDLRRDEVAFRKQYEQLVVDKQLTTIFRPGNRIYPNRRGYKLGEIVIARIIEKCGDDEKKIPPLFNDIRMAVQIKNIEVIDIDALKGNDFDGSSPDVFDVLSLEIHLKTIYCKPVVFSGREITRIELSYVDINDG